ncbi:MAG: universal stress protein, partial [Anaerolineales bacterium]|nr:universal stress protein [Anaerolineales bacterium]
MGHNNQQPISVLIANDGSEHSQAARQLVCDLPLPASSNISLVSVVSSRKVSNLAYFAVGMEKIENQFHKKGFKVDTDLLVGHPAKTLVDFAEKKKVGLLVIGAGGLRAKFG